MNKSHYPTGNQPQTSLAKSLAILLILALATVIGLASASVFTVHATQASSAVNTSDIQLVAGPDGTSNPNTYPSATVTVSPNHDSAVVALSLFPSQKNTPQPATYYTNLLQITNTGKTNHTIDAITITDISGASNLGSLTIYYYAKQTDSPQNSQPLGYATLTDRSTGEVALFSGAQTLVPTATNYIEIVGYAAPQATVGSAISFTLGIQCT